MSLPVFMTAIKCESVDVLRLSGYILNSESCQVVTGEVNRNLPACSACAAPVVADVFYDEQTERWGGGVLGKQTADGCTTQSDTLVRVSQYLHCNEPVRILGRSGSLFTMLTDRTKRGSGGGSVWPALSWVITLDGENPSVTQVGVSGQHYKVNCINCLPPCWIICEWGSQFLMLVSLWGTWS